MRAFDLVAATTLLLLAACGGSSPPKTADSADEPTDGTKSAQRTDGSKGEIGEVSEPVADCVGLDEFTCQITGGCEWSAGKKSCSKQSSGK